MGLGRDRLFDKRPNQSKQKVPPKGVGGGSLGEGEGVWQGSVQKSFPSLRLSPSTLESSVKSCPVGPGLHPSFDASFLLAVVRNVMKFY